MPKTAPSLMKSVKVVVSVSPAEYERWERLATQNEMRVPEFVRYLIGQAAANWSNRMPYPLNLDALAVSPLQTGSNATVPALPMHMRPQFKKVPQRSLCLAQSWPLAAQLLFSLHWNAPGVPPVCNGMPPVCNESCTVYLPECHGIATNAATGSHRQLRMWDHWSHPPATNVGPAFPPSSYKRGTSVPTLQLRMWDHVPTPLPKHCPDKQQ